MKKTSLNIKRIRFFKKFILWFLVIQVPALILFVTLFNKSHPVSTNDCITQTIVVDDIRVVEKKKIISTEMYIYSGEKIYCLCNLGRYGKNPLENENKINIGDEISIVYKKSKDFLYGSHLIVDARTEKTVYQDFSEYNADKQMYKNVPLLIFIVFELVFLSLTLVIFIVNDDLKLFLWIKKNHKKQNNSYQNKNS